MGSLLARFRDANEPDWEDLKRRSMYPDLIGRKVTADAHTPYWLRCGCGMLVMTARDLAGGSTVCANCMQHQHDAVDGIGVFVPQRNPTLKPGTERRMLFGLVVFCLLAAGLIGQRVWEAPSRTHTTTYLQLD